MDLRWASTGWNMVARATQDCMTLRYVRIGTYLVGNFISVYTECKNELASENLPREAAGIIGTCKHRSVLLKILGRHWKGRQGIQLSNSRNVRTKCLDTLMLKSWSLGLRTQGKAAILDVKKQSKSDIDCTWDSYPRIFYVDDETGNQVQALHVIDLSTYYTRPCFGTIALKEQTDSLHHGADNKQINT